MRTFLLGCVLVCACGGDTTTNGDASTDGASNDVTTTQDAAKDSGAPNDAATTNDSSIPNDSGFGDGGLTSGEQCDPNNNLCLSNLLCCSEPTHLFDGGPMSEYRCEAPVNGGCPLQP